MTDTEILGLNCIIMLKNIINACLAWFTQIINATGLRFFWTGVVILAVLMSIVFVPMRSGQMLGGGAISTFATSRISNAKRNKRAEQDRMTPKVRYHVHTHIRSNSKNGTKKGS